MTTSIRTRIYSFGSHLSLPVTQKALGFFEGEHLSDRGGRGFDFFDLHPYQSSDEARLIDWKASARRGKPVIARKRREVTSSCTLAIDVGVNMLASANTTECLLTVAENTLLLFALLSLKRSDTLSLICGDSSHIRRFPFTGGYRRFEKVLDASLGAFTPVKPDLDALLSFCLRTVQKNSLLVLATDSSIVDSSYYDLIEELAGRYFLTLIAIPSSNPYDPSSFPTLDIETGRSIPAFLATPTLAKEITRRHTIEKEAFSTFLSRIGVTLLTPSSSEEILKTFTDFLSLSSLKHGRHTTLSYMSSPHAYPREEEK